MIVNTDFHIHTTLSACCADPRQSAENILLRARALGLNTICITDHVWDDAIPGASAWYAPQTFRHIMGIKDSLPRDTLGIRVLLGCETEYAGGVIGLSAENRAKLDFVLVPHSHIHMRGYVMPEECVEDADVAEFLCQSFKSLVEKEFATSIAHPFAPVGRTAQQAHGILRHIPMERFEELFTAAREHNAALEINTATVSQMLQYQPAHALYVAMYTLAKECGCRFTIGSDAHAQEDMDKIALAGEFCDSCGITARDLLAI